MTYYNPFIPNILQIAWCANTENMFFFVRVRGDRALSFTMARSSIVGRLAETSRVSRMDVEDDYGGGRKDLDP